MIELLFFVLFEETFCLPPLPDAPPPMEIPIENESGN